MVHSARPSTAPTSNNTIITNNNATTKPQQAVFKPATTETLETEMMQQQPVFPPPDMVQQVKPQQAQQAITQQQAPARTSMQQQQTITAQSQTATPAQQSLLVQQQQPLSTLMEGQVTIKAPDEVIIHVFDEANKITKDFTCKKDILLREMKYFKTYLNDNSSFDDIDISVHCDVNIFQWLVDYIHLSQATKEVHILETSWAISILISSDFLEMDHLVEDTLQFVKQKLSSIIKLPIDLDCINNKLLTRLANMFTEDELDATRDKRDKIVNKLFLKKLEQLLEQNEHCLYKCQLCQNVFAKKHHEWLPCTKAKLYIDFRGKVHAKHSIDDSWNVNKYLIQLKRAMPWRDVYWKVWGTLHSLACKRCNARFPVCEMNHCSYHPDKPVFESGTNIGVYPCCKSQALRFDSSGAMVIGCTARNHVVTPTLPEETRILEITLRKLQLVTVPFVKLVGNVEEKNAETEQDENHVCYDSDCNNYI